MPGLSDGGNADEQAAFGRLMMSAMKDAGESRALTYNAMDFSIHVDGASDFNLNNAFRDYKRAETPARAAVLARYAKFAVSSDNVTTPPFEVASPHLLPMVRDRMYFRSFSSKHENVQKEYLLTPLAHSFEVAIAVDSEQASMTVGAPYLKTWHRSLHEIEKISLDNLQKMSEDPFEKVTEGLFRSPWQDNYDGSRVLLHDLIRKLDVKGDPVAMLPNRITLLVSGTDNPEGLARMAEEAEKAYAEDRAVSLVAIHLHNDTWTEWLPPVGDPVRGKFLDLRMIGLNDNYAQQKDLLQKEFDQEKRDILATDFKLFKNPKTGRFYSATTWIEGVVCALPRADVIILARQKGKSVEILQSIDRDKLERIAPGLVKAQDTFPPSFLTQGFPSEKQRQAMGKSSLMPIPARSPTN